MFGFLACGFCFNFLQRCDLEVRQIKLFLVIILLVVNSFAFAAAATNNIRNQGSAFYIGIQEGYGNTNWSELVSQDASSSLSTPIAVHDDGFIYGLLAGFEVNPFFAVEFNYINYPKTFVTLDPANVYWPVTKFMSKTHLFALIAKFMVPVGHSHLRAFAVAGAGYTYRSDVLADKGHVGPSFGAGFNYLINPHVMTELGFQYDTGFGLSE